MFPTVSNNEKMGKIVEVAIPSNRVNVSYKGKLTSEFVLKNCGRNPLKSGQCFLRSVAKLEVSYLYQGSRNPLKSGQCFLQDARVALEEFLENMSQSPQIGSMFPTNGIKTQGGRKSLIVAIPSNRVNVSYYVFLKEKRN